MLLCLQYSKDEEARFLSHLDLMTAMERAFRRAQLPLAFSEGFNPHPRISYASALAVGVTSEDEYLDLQLMKDISAEEVMRRVRGTLPTGLRLLAAVPVTKRKESLMALINMARYRVEIRLLQVLKQETVEEMVNRVLSSTTCLVLRQGKKGEREVDIRPGLYWLEGRIEANSEHENSKLIIEMDVQTGSLGNVKPVEVMEILKEKSFFTWGNNIRIHRIGLFIREDDKIWSPLERS